MLAHIRRASVRAHNQDSQCWRATAAARSAADLDCAHGAAVFSMGCGWTRGPTPASDSAIQIAVDAIMAVFGSPVALEDPPPVSAQAMPQALIFLGPSHPD